MFKITGFAPDNQNQFKNYFIYLTGLVESSDH